MQGMLAIWTDVAPEAEDDFNAWYDREHLFERAEMPGFYNARRYVALSGKPKYLALYDTASVGALATPEYRARITGPTEWSARVMKGFRNTTRCVFRQVFQHGHGWGGVALTHRLFVPEDKVDAVAKALSEGALPRAAETTGVCGVFLLRDEPDDGGPVGKAQGPRTTLAIHAACVDEAAAKRVLDGALSPAALAKAGAGEEVETGTYRFLSGVDRAVTERKC